MWITTKLRVSTIQQVQHNTTHDAHSLHEIKLNKITSWQQYGWVSHPYVHIAVLRASTRPSLMTCIRCATWTTATTCLELNPVFTLRWECNSHEWAYGQSSTVPASANGIRPSPQMLLHHHTRTDRRPHKRASQGTLQEANWRKIHALMTYFPLFFGGSLHLLLQLQYQLCEISVFGLVVNEIISNADPSTADQLVVPKRR